MPLRSRATLALDIIEIYMLTLWGGDRTTSLKILHDESSIVLMVQTVYRVRSRISSGGGGIVRPGASVPSLPRFGWDSSAPCGFSGAGRD